MYIVHTEDLSNVENHTNTISFSIQPFQCRVVNLLRELKLNAIKHNILK